MDGVPMIDLGSPENGLRALAAAVCLKALRDQDFAWLNDPDTGGDILSQLGIPVRVARASLGAIEQQADDEFHGRRVVEIRSGRRGRAYPVTLVKHAIDLHDDGISWSNIARRLHVGEDAIRRAADKLKRQIAKGTIE